MQATSFLLILAHPSKRYLLSAYILNVVMTLIFSSDGILTLLGT